MSDSIPRPRGKVATYVGLILMSGLACLYFMLTPDYHIKFIVQQVAQQLIVSFFALCLLRLCEFVEELGHKQTRYQNSWVRALNASLDWKKYGFCLLISLLFNWVLPYEKHMSYAVPTVGQTISLTCFCVLFLKVFQLDVLSPAQISEISETNKCNVAHGLAWSYYLGYLKIVLPKLEEKINQYHREYGNVLQQKGKKLYILIPFSCKVLDKLEKVDTNIVFYQNLPELLVDRAGIKSRSYKHSIYLIYDQKKQQPHHCILEYATPLRSLFEMTNDSAAAFSKEQRLDQAKLFYRTLKSILNNVPEVTGSYRLIPYDDDLEGAELGPHFVSEEILKHMRQELTEYPVAEPSNANETDCMSSEPHLMISDDPKPLRSYCP
ncbi:stimulator of interferon genes protein [Callorhinchus milii]|uniref:Stimulator of interferon genes protein n=1 Tax=Callorhinchus milii TaxID=7868 RepID=A0A4W3GFJ3_CALMI|nr:stimulator of interferon genes protein [Callorhinchus milii]XP_007904452.1 stimulator of interferon genes protein [Callorhinchus milii]|eukprot:gi/632975839/ref/XP_007904451.1/ PREDICTED: stimulator of interferon genes protein [Callorhinchus milii]